MDSQALIIRRAAAADAAGLASFAARTFAETFARDNTPEDMAAFLARSYGEAQQGAELADPSIVTLVAERGGSTVAFAQLRKGTTPACVTGAPAIELWRFYVDRPWHGRGVARTLMDAVANAAQQLGARTLWLGVWERNPRALAFYRKSGFQDVGTQSFMVGEDRQTDRVMTRSLVES